MNQGTPSPSPSPPPHRLSVSLNLNLSIATFGYFTRLLYWSCTSWRLCSHRNIDAHAFEINQGKVL